MREYERISTRFDLLQKKNNKNIFDQNVREYCSLIYNRGETSTSVMGYNFANVNDMMDEYVTTIVNTIWTFSSTPFIIRSTVSDEFTEYHDNIALRIFNKLKDRSSKFNFALTEFVRSRYELGIGVFLIDIVDGKYKFTTVNPTKVQYDFEDGELIEVIIEDQFFIEEYNGGGFKKGFKHFRKVKNKWEYKRWIYEHSTEASIKLDHQPVFILFSNARLDDGVPVGKGIELLPILKNINNILKSLDEASFRELKPVAVINSEEINLKKTVSCEDMAFL